MSKDLVPSNDEMKVIEAMAKYAIDSKHLERIGGLAGAMAIALYARELGIPLMAAMYGGIRPVLGKVEIAPQMMNAMIRKAGHKLTTVVHTEQKCEIKGIRKDTQEAMTSIFTIDDAKRAKIYKAGGAWESYPRNMLYARAIANLARWLFPDVIGMAYVEGELEDSNIEETIDIKDESKEEASSTEEKISEMDSKDVLTMIGDDFEYRDRILKYYKVTAFTEIPAKELPTIVERVEIYNKQRLEKELNTGGNDD